MVVIPTNTLFPRFIIEHDDCFWTGSRWSGNQMDAMLYREIGVACKEARRLDQLLCKSVSAFTVPLHFAVNSYWPMDIEQLRQSFVHCLDVKLTYADSIFPNVEIANHCIKWGLLMKNG